jgi:hypothetical protein
MISIDGDGDKIFLHIDSSAISMIMGHAPAAPEQPTV